MLTNKVLFVCLVLTYNGVIGLEKEDFPWIPKWHEGLGRKMNHDHFPGSHKRKEEFDKHMKNEHFPGSMMWEDHSKKEMEHEHFTDSKKWHEEFEKEMNMPMKPCIPKNFPNPPMCEPVANPGYEYPKFTLSTKKKYRIERNSYLCSDPDYGDKSFYKLVTAVIYEDNNRSETSHYYEVEGTPFTYSSRIKLIPVNQECI